MRKILSFSFLKRKKKLRFQRMKSKKGDIWSYRVVYFFKKKFRVKVAQAPPDVKEAFAGFTDGATLMTAHHLLHFLIQFQGQPQSTISDAENIIKHIAHIHPDALTTEDFQHYLFSEDLNPPISSQVHQDMNSPLSHYYIFTGHNSYLTGNQLTSDCSVEPIIEALKRGVRGIELDIWPNSSKDNVNVLHGGTFTDPVQLIECLKCIKEYAFVASPYPVVITLEDHLDAPLQAKVAKMATETFGDMLYRPNSECLKEFPSPEELKYQIIISTKPPKEYLESKPIEENGMVSSDDDDKGDSNNKEHNVDDSDECDRFSGQLGAPEYKQLIGIHAKKHKGKLRESLKVDIDKVGRLSLNEQALEKATISYGIDLVRFTQKNILRVYPKGTRIDSSNYNPLMGWMHGAQMLAFNMQGYGKPLRLMHGMFRANGGCGYVKKPDYLIKEYPQNPDFTPRANIPMKKTSKGYHRPLRLMQGIFSCSSVKKPDNPKADISVRKTLKVRVYMGDGWHLDFSRTHFDKYSPPDFYVRVGIAGVPGDAIKKKTKTVYNNWTPVWDKEFIFPLTVPELALLRVEVREYDRNEKDDFGGQTCLPVSELRPGIRAVPLFDRKGKKYKSVKLLMRFQFV